MLSEILLWLLVVNLGVAFGAGLYEARMMVPQWFEPHATGLKVNSKAFLQTDPGMKFWAFVTTGPLTLLTLANLGAALYCQNPRHDWWLASAIVTLVERIGTFGFFIPTAIKLMRAEALPAVQASNMAVRWVRLNHLRSAFNLIGWLLAMKAL